MKNRNEIDEGKEGKMDDKCSVRRRIYIKFKRRKRKAQNH
jgi:hypothetical protein